MRVLYRTLDKKNRGEDPDRLERVRFVVRSDGSRGGDEVGAREAGRRNANQPKIDVGSVTK
jgi:hypothetical protein